MDAVHARWRRSDDDEPRNYVGENAPKITSSWESCIAGSHLFDDRGQINCIQGAMVVLITGISEEIVVGTVPAREFEGATEP